MPNGTCLHKIIKYIYDESLPYAKTCVGACFMNFIMFLSHFTMYTGAKKEIDDKAYKSKEVPRDSIDASIEKKHKEGGLGLEEIEI